MPADLRRYLVDRFATDAATLRERAAHLGASPAPKGKKSAGPDAATSLRMASACDDVVSILTALPAHASVTELLSSLSALAPLLDARAQNAVSDPLVRSVYAGAATRLREVVRAEQSGNGAASVDDFDESDDDDDVDDDILDYDEDVDK